ncbi:Plant UBX domain-containing protein 5, partial [Linum perenne]
FVFQSPQKYPTSSSPPPPLTNYSNAIAPGDSNERSNMESAGEKKTALTDADITALVDSFREITSSTRDEAAFYLESHQWDLDIAVSTFLDHDHNAAAHAARAPPDEHAPPLSPPRSRSRSMSPAPATASRLPQEGRSKEDKKKKKKSCGSGGASGSRNRGGIRTLADLNRNTAGSDSDDDDDDDDEEMQEYYTGGEKSGMLVQDPSKNYDADAIFDHAKNSLAVQKPEDIARATAAAASKSFTGTGRLLSGETVQTTPQPPAFVNHTITLWRNGFTVDDGPLRRLNDPANAEFLEVITLQSVKRSECPRELFPPDRRTEVHLDLVKRDENYKEPAKKKSAAPAFQGVGRTLGASTSSEPPPSGAPMMTAPPPSSGLTVDSSSPTTSIQLRLADGTRMVSHFNLHHTVGDVRAFIVASRPGEASNFHLQTMGFPPRKLDNPDQTIQDAGIANSVVIQKF